MLARIGVWIDRNILDLGRQMRLSYLPPLMVYLAAGISGLTAIVGTFFVKDYLGLSAAFLATLGFWAGIPWALKMPIGHLVDLTWRWKSLYVYLGAGLIACALLIMLGLLTDPEAMGRLLPVETWFVVSVLLSPVGYVIQDVVADAMTVEAVPKVDEQGRPLAPDRRRLMHTTMQTLGRVAIIGGGIAVSLVNILMFEGVAAMSQVDKLAAYVEIYQMALAIPVISILGVTIGQWLKRRHARELRAKGFDAEQIRQMVEHQQQPPAPNWWILGGSLMFVGFTIATGLSDLPYNQEIVFAGSMTIILVMIYRLVQVLEPPARQTLIGTAIIIFVYRALPGPGAGATWWQIDDLGFDQQFLSLLALIASSLTLLGMFLFRRFMAERSIAYVVGFLTLASTLLSLPIIGMYYGLHEWTEQLTHGIVDARFIAVIDTTLESPLGQVSMIPMLAWIANSAPARLKATFFAVMASFTNLALSLRELGTRYLNEIFTVSREVRDPQTGVVTVPADYSELGMLLITVALLTLTLPFLAIGLVRWLGLRSA